MYFQMISQLVSLCSSVTVSPTIAFFLILSLSPFKEPLESVVKQFFHVIFSFKCFIHCQGKYIVRKIVWIFRAYIQGKWFSVTQGMSVTG